MANETVQGSLADRFGKKWFILSGGVAGVIGNVVAGSAKSTEIIIAGQALNGLGSSLYVSCVVIPGQAGNLHTDICASVTCHPFWYGNRPSFAPQLCTGIHGFCKWHRLDHDTFGL